MLIAVHQNAALVRASAYGSLAALGNGARVLLSAAPYRRIATRTVRSDPKEKPQCTDRGLALGLGNHLALIQMRCDHTSPYHYTGVWMNA